MHLSEKWIKWSKENSDIAENNSHIDVSIDMEHIIKENWEPLEKAIIDMLSILYNKNVLTLRPLAVFAGRDKYHRFGIHVEFNGRIPVDDLAI